MEELTKKSAEMNEFVKKLAKERGLDTIDLFSPMRDLAARSIGATIITLPQRR